MPVAFNSNSGSSISSSKQKVSSRTQLLSLPDDKKVKVPSTVEAKNVIIYLRHGRDKVSAGFANVSLIVHGLSIDVRGIGILYDKETDIFRARPPYTESPDKRVGASWKKVVTYLEENQINPSIFPMDILNLSYIDPGHDADLEDLSRPWISRWPSVSGDISDISIRLVSGLVSLCNVCTRCVPRQEAKYKELVTQIAFLRKSLTVDDVDTLNAIVEVQKEIDSLMDTCSTQVKNITIDSDCIVSCSAHCVKEMIISDKAKEFIGTSANTGEIPI
jgi:hypothetical protein